MPHNLLLADDSITIQRVIKLTFADEDVDVMTVGDGDQAVAAIDKAPPDIVLADVAMPGRTGYEVAQHIRATPHLAHIPVVLLTGAFEPVDEARASEVGCDGVLAKPFEPEVVVNRVRELLLRGRTVAPPPPPVPAPAPVSPAPAASTEAAPPAPAAAPARSAVDIDAYFDRLDQAFANLAVAPKEPPAAAAPGPPGPHGDDESEPEPMVFGAATDAPARPAFEPAMQSIVDVFEGMLVRESPATPAADLAKRPAAETPVLTFPSAASPAPAQPAALRATAQAGPAPLVIAVKSGGGEVPAAGDLSPAGDLSHAGELSPAGQLSNDQVDRIVNRVLDALTAKVAAANVSEIVAQVAARLVRDEIDEIKRRL